MLCLAIPSSRVGTGGILLCGEGNVTHGGMGFDMAVCWRQKPKSV